MCKIFRQNAMFFDSISAGLECSWIRQAFIDLGHQLRADVDKLQAHPGHAEIVTPWPRPAYFSPDRLVRFNIFCERIIYCVPQRHQPFKSSPQAPGKR